MLGFCLGLNAYILGHRDMVSKSPSSRHCCSVLGKHATVILIQVSFHLPLWEPRFLLLRTLRTVLTSVSVYKVAVLLIKNLIQNYSYPFQDI